MIGADKIGLSYSLLKGQVEALGLSPKPVMAKPRRGRPREQEKVVRIFIRRLRSGTTDRSWMLERHAIVRAWTGPNVPSDRTIRRAVRRLHDLLRWRDGKLASESVANVIREVEG